MWWLELIPSGDGQWIRLDRAGRSHEVVKTSRLEKGYEVLADANYLRRYLAARGVYLLIQHRHTVSANLDDVNRIDLEVRNDFAMLEFCATESIGGRKHNFFADLLGKHVVLPFSQAGADPDDTLQPERFQEFIVDVDPGSGEPLRLSCGDSAREGETNHLASVFFDADVLTRYRDDPKRYVLSRNHVWCLDLWGLDIDINKAGLVHVWLGDLRRLPEAERDHWLLHNVPPHGGISEIRFRRDILNQWVVDDRPDLPNLRRAKRRLMDAVRTSFGVEIFRPLTVHDNEAFEGLSLCTNPTAAQRDLSVLTLAKGVVECLDVKQLRKLAGASDAEPSLNCLTAWVDAIGGDSEQLCAPLRLLQSLRSTGAAHMRGSKYDAVIASAGWQTTPPDQQFQQLVGDVTRALNKIAELVETHRDATP